MQPVSIQRYQPRYQADLIELILPIQNQEFAIAITAEQQPDLREVENFYQQGKGDFWLALAEDRVVGSIGLKDIGDRHGALRKMFVAQAWRGREHGVAKGLLEALLAHARQQELQAVWLGTTAKFLAAHRFYEKNGFAEVAEAMLPATFPLMKVDSKFYRLTL